MGWDGGTNQSVANQNTGQASTGGGDGVIINTFVFRKSARMWVALCLENGLVG
jgi:hypothetical protein